MADASAEDDRVSGFLSAFPSRLGRDVAVASSVILSGRLAPACPFRVVVEGERVTIPYRIYDAEPSVDGYGSLTPRQQVILACIYTRHHNGRVRQRNLQNIIGFNESWVVPFVVRLVGEYVLEIQLDIRAELIEIDEPGTSQNGVYGRFLAENSEFLTLTGQRVASYWDCYYRSIYADRRHYPGHTLLRSLRTAAEEYRTLKQA